MCSTFRMSLFPVPLLDVRDEWGSDLRAPQTAVPALQWKDLPVHRRLALAWRLTAGDPTLRQTSAPCFIGRGLMPAPVKGAARGSNGQFHLVHADSDRPCGDGAHDDSISWAPDGSRFALHPAMDDAGPDVAQLATTRGIAAIDETSVLSNPWFVPSALRCASAKLWPSADLSVGSQRGARYRRALAPFLSALGSLCAACGRTTAVVIDHDHMSGLIRGLVCRDCNAQVEGCVHLSGCDYAEYLNAPPLLPFAAAHPRPDVARDLPRLNMAARIMHSDPLLLRDLDSLPASAPLRRINW